MSISQMDLSLFPPPSSFPLLPSPLSLSLVSCLFLLFFSCPRRGGSGSPPMSLLLLSLSSFFFSILSSAFLSLLFPFVRLSSSLAFLYLYSAVSYLFANLLVDPSVIVCFPRIRVEATRSSFQLEGESPRGCPSRSPRRFKLLMSIFRLVTLSELVHRRRCVLPIKVFNESERKMGPGTTAIALLLRAPCRYPLSAYTRYILIDIHGRFDNLFIMQRFNKQFYGFLHALSSFVSRFNTH